ncbi:MAG: DegV family protein [Clostridium sp.]
MLKNGQIGEIATLFGAFLQIRPLFTVDGGKLLFFNKVRTRQKVI